MRLAIPPMVLLCLTATWLVWGSTYLAIKYALISFPPFFQMGTRFLLAGIVLMSWTLALGSGWPNFREWRNALIIGGLMLGGGIGGVAYAEQTVASGLVVAFIAVVPLMIAVINLLRGIVPGRVEGVGIVLGLTGVTMLARGSGFQASPSGLMAIGAGCLAWSIGSVLSQRLMLAPGASGFASEMVCGGIVLMAIAAFRQELPQWPPRPIAIVAWAYLVVFGSLVAFNAYMYLLAHVSAGLASSYTFVNPIIAMLLGIVVAGETVTNGEWTAAAVVLAGVVLLLWRPKGSGIHRPVDAHGDHRHSEVVCVSPQRQS